MIKNTSDSYGSIAKSFHWIVGLMMIGLIIAGLIMTRMEAGALKWDIYGLHKATGILVLALVFMRAIWRARNVQPDSHPNHQKWEKHLAHSAHIGLYIMMIGMPLTGWAMSSAGGHPISLYGLFTVPPLLDKTPDLAKIFNLVHEYMGYAMIAIILLHIAGALKHHVIDKDSTLRRMLP